MMIKCAIIDDEPLAIQLLADYARQSKDLELIGTYTNPIEALHALEQSEVELVFLDIQMAELTGLQFMRIAKDKYQFVLTTAYESYALESYDFDVVDYLLKPIYIDRFLMAVEKVKAKLLPKEEGSISDSTKEKDFIFIKTGYKIQKINLGDILYFEGLGDYVAIHLADGTKVLTLEKMKDFEGELPSQNFIRIHKSHIIAVDKIGFIERNRVVINEKYLPIGNTYSAAFWAKIKS